MSPWLYQSATGGTTVATTVATYFDPYAGLPASDIPPSY